MRVVLVCLTLTFVAGSLSADEPSRSPIRDGLKLFSKDAIAKATKEIRAIHSDSGIGLFVDTVKDAPEAAKLRKPIVPEWLRIHLRPNPRDVALDTWAWDRADNVFGSNPGVYVAVFNAGSGHEVRMVVWPRDLGQTVFWNRQRAMRIAFEKDLKKNPDQALEHLVSSYREQMALIKNHPVPLRTVPALFVVGSLLVVWLLAMAIRWRVLAHVRPEDPQPVAIYQPAMMATLFGVPAAFWINDELFHVIPPEVTPVERSAESDSFSLPPEPPPLSAEPARSSDFSLPQEPPLSSEPVSERPPTT